ncbi:MaoC family dehydratase [Cognatiluteimonas telluris]|uniref:MaoC family dehydratase n=1 Tax=Cognatiluteimonas telluris TaxID=1104775 RepID=UPI001407BFC2|nr:MaoC family dehydratase [Lysobacter telluris]
MELRFEQSDVEHWASFSGDYNPIHFDIDRARDLGVDALIVHGMLAMLPVKREFGAFAAAAEEPTPAWRRFRTLLRAPIPHGERLHLSTRNGARGLQFRVDGTDVEEEYFRGSFGDGADPAVALLKRPVILPDTTLDPAVFAQFHHHYGESEPWVALDAVLFADFMRTKIEPLLAWTHERAGEQLASGIEQSLIVHTSHTVTFAPAACAPEGIAWRPGGTLAYEVRAPEVISGDGQLICNVPLVAKADGVVVMQVELGLLLKLPAAFDSASKTSDAVRVPLISNQGVAA